MTATGPFTPDTTVVYEYNDGGCPEKFTIDHTGMRVLDPDDYRLERVPDGAVPWPWPDGVPAFDVKQVWVLPPTG